MVKKHPLRHISYIIAAILIIGWLVGFFILRIGTIIHVLLITALVMIVLRTFGEKKPHK